MKTPNTTGHTPGLPPEHCHNCGQLTIDFYLLQCIQTGGLVIICSERCS